MLDEELEVKIWQLIRGRKSMLAEERERTMRGRWEMHEKEHTGKAYHWRSGKHSWINVMQDM
jgi:hypothetical protein